MALVLRRCARSVLVVTEGRGSISHRRNRHKPSLRSLSVAHELSGLGSTRVVRFSASGWRRIDEPDDVATGPENAEVSGCFEPLGTAGTIDDGGERAFGDVGAAVSALPGPV